MNAEKQRLQEQYSGTKNWLKWGPYLSERQWGTVREDYSPNGDAWNYFPHDHARSRVYRWGEDGIGGISDDKQNLCFAWAFWNGQDAILKERLFGLTNSEGNHGEDVKELYYYLDNTPSHSYMKMLYKYPQSTFPYEALIEGNAERSRSEAEYELLDTGIFDQNRYFDILIEYAKADTDDLLIKLTVSNRGDKTAPLHILPTLWFRNLWAFGLMNQRPSLDLANNNEAFIKATHENLGDYFLYFEQADKILFTKNKSNNERLWGVPNLHPFVKDAFHRAVTNQDFGFLEGNNSGTKASPMYFYEIAAGESQQICLRLSKEQKNTAFGEDFEQTFQQRISESDIFYDELIATENKHFKDVKKQALSGLLWSKQYYNYDVNTWLSGDYSQAPPPEGRHTGRNETWQHLKAEDIISMPDKWEYPWFAAWDLAFHSIAVAEVDIEFAKKQIQLLLSENYISSDGQIPAYEWAFSDLNPPVQAYATLEIFKIEQRLSGIKDLDFLGAIFDKLLLNYHWWLSREDANHNNLFEGGFLGLDNISVIDRSNGVPDGGRLDQADGTAWMALFSLNMLEIAIELSPKDAKYDKYCLYFFEEFVKIAESLHNISSVWLDDDPTDDGFFYDVLQLPDGRSIPIKMRSLVGVIPLFSTFLLDKDKLQNVPLFKDYLQNFEKGNNRYQIFEDTADKSEMLFSMLTADQLKALLDVLLNEDEMLAPGGIRSVSKAYQNGFSLDIDNQNYSLHYVAGESDSAMYGGNSNWRGPIWMPINYLIIKALQIYSDYFSEDFDKNIYIAHSEIKKRLQLIFIAEKNGKRPVHGDYKIYETEHFEDLILFYEHFHAETSHGIGASHQTGWTALVASLG